MTFDLHMHSGFSDGSHWRKGVLQNHMDFRVITDHDTAEYYSNGLNECSFTGIEITAGVNIQGYDMYCELLFYGFPVEDFSQFQFPKQYYINKSWEDLIQFLQPWRNKGAKLIVAHPHILFRTNRDFEKDLDFIGQYVDGFESLHECAVDDKEKLFLLDYCRSRNKISSGGSDTHGCLRETPGLSMVNLYPELFSWIPEMADKFQKGSV